ncbi:MAG: hypothetical protein OEW97_03330 [Gammaproteobacteria bacterium]|nr:hypothetical protein [Gammaproteobacteria bacterium]
MSDSLLSFVIVFAELGGILLIVVLAWIVFFIRNAKKEGVYTKDLISAIKKIIPEHREKLKAHFENEMEIETEKSKANVESLLNSEKRLYEHLVNVSINKDTSLLKLTIKDINTLINDYVRMLTLKGQKLANETRDARELQLRKENEALRIENSSLKNQLAAETETIENMMNELAAMYEGGKKEGEQRVKNEMYKLKQSLKSEEVKAKEEVKKLDLDSDKI